MNVYKSLKTVYCIKDSIHMMLVKCIRVLKVKIEDLP